MNRDALVYAMILQGAYHLETCAVAYVSKTRIFVAAKIAL
jgi:hypothetical protein